MCGDIVHPLLGDQHALRASKTSKGSVRGEVGAADPTSDSHIREFVDIVSVSDRSIQHLQHEAI